MTLCNRTSYYNMECTWSKNRGVGIEFKLKNVCGKKAKKKADAPLP